jgi:phage shock protein PspC (stress-responsive transcriptional regulator)
MQRSKRLYRSLTDRKIAGVCGGLAEYFGADPILVRGLFVALAIAGGAGVALYFVLWIVVPKSDRAGQQPATIGVVDENVGESAA